MLESSKRQILATAVVDAGGAVGEISTLDHGDSTSGTFSLTYGAATTSPIAYNVTVGDLKTAIEALSTVTSTATITGTGAVATPWVIEITSPLTDLAVSVNDIDLAGGSGPTLTETRKGGINPSLAAGASVDGTATIVGVKVGDKVTANPPSTFTSGLVCGGAWVSAADTVKVRIGNITGGAITPTDDTWAFAIQY